MITEQNYRSIGWTTTRLARNVELALATIDLSTAQYRMLLQLAQGDEASTSLARKLAVSAPSVTAVVDGFVSRGAIERTHSEEDRRRVSLALTPIGLALLAEAEAVVSARLEGIADELENEESIRIALSALDLWAEALEKARARRLALRESPVEVSPR
ncbi:MAG TPA: MarR family transcriptional regulator [Acidimicrobiales bacterium]